jgi:DNA-binding NarL/FixJ family response regulator
LLIHCGAVLIVTMSHINILLIDDHALFRSGLRLLLSTGLENIQVFESGSLEESMRSALDAPAVILLDIRLHGLSGLESIALLKRKWPQAAIVMLSSESAPEIVSLALERGAAAFVSKGDTADNIIAVIRQVLQHHPFPVPPAATAQASLAPVPCLTPRQCEVLDLLCQGLPNKLIARRLDLSENTVRSHVQAVLGFLQVSNRSEAAFAARRLGLVN